MEIDDVYTLEPDTVPEELPPTQEEPPYYFIPVMPSEELPSSSSVSPDEVDLSGYTLDGMETFALSPVTSSTGLKGVLLKVIGPYDNIITQFRYQSNTSSNYTYVHEMTPDYPWIASAVLFIVLLYSVFQCFRRALWPK